jgi:hypothetical protein
MSKILLVDVDSKIPNIALMKISTFYKQKNYDVDLIRCNISYYPQHNNKIVQVNGVGYEQIFVSTIFTNTLNKLKINFNNNIVIGGTGFSITKVLPIEIQQQICDYSLYPDNDTAYGFITRGCIRNCDFCFVPKKEGKLYQENSIDNIIQPQFQKTKFLDNNILAYNKHKEILTELKNRGCKYQFNQGLDIRLIDSENSKLLIDSNYLGDYFFAFDNIDNEKIINKKLNIFRDNFSKNSNWIIKFFIYCHPSMNITNDLMYRILWCKNNKVLPYLMRDISCWQSPNKKLYINLARWCNQPRLFRSMSFEQFLSKI